MPSTDKIVQQRDHQILQVRMQNSMTCFHKVWYDKGIRYIIQSMATYVYTHENACLRKITAALAIATTGMWLQHCTFTVTEWTRLGVRAQYWNACLALDLMPSTSNNSHNNKAVVQILWIQQWWKQVTSVTYNMKGPYKHNWAKTYQNYTKNNSPSVKLRNVYN